MRGWIIVILLVKGLLAQLLACLLYTSTSDTGAPLPWEQPESTNPYMKGDKVTHAGKTWVSTIDNNVWEPGVYGWEVEGDGDT